ncbi:CD166 antigen isoform X2 [Rana temporaria]|uniref:CD166 antigen isoform X2 n=1 Tax=Rana temporaria TaxID=8407 RepID=UPI001AACBF03|nr:CD166 antigen isoform X2 [Rana temporaria]
MAASSLLTVCVLCATAFRTGFGFHTVSAIYGETINIPCGQDVMQDLLFGKWKYEKPDGTAVFVASRSAVKKSFNFDDVPEYNGRLNLSENYTLSISNARISDEKRFVCMLITEDNVFEEPTIIKVFKPPSKPEIINQPTFLETGKLNLVGDCVAKDSYPDGNITWYRNGQVLLPVDGVVTMEWWKEKNSTSGLHSMRSTLEYMSTKEDINAQFSCAVTFYMPDGLATMNSDPAAFNIYYPTEKVTIHVQSPKKTIKEGDNITLKCIGNGNPPPEEFLFYLPGQEEGIRSSSAYHITDIKRNATGDYKCSLLNKIMIASTMVTVHYLDLSLTPSGEITKQVGDSLSVSCIPSASKNVSVTWMKNQKILAQPSFSNLQYRDSGVYECETSLMEVDGLRRKKTLSLTVEGKPRIKLSKKTNSDGKSKTILYEVDGYPKPEVQCSRLGNDLYLNKTEETMLSNGKYSAKIIISPEENVTIICSAENKLGREVHSLNVSASDNNDHAKLIVGIVVGLLLAALVAGLAYWLYIKKSGSRSSRHIQEQPAGERGWDRLKEGAADTLSTSKHVGKELGNTEENKKLEENNHKSEA